MHGPEERDHTRARRAERGIGPPPGLLPFGQRARDRRHWHSQARASIRARQARLRDAALAGIGENNGNDYTPRTRPDIPRATTIAVITALLLVLTGIVALGLVLGERSDSSLPAAATPAVKAIT